MLFWGGLAAGGSPATEGIPNGRRADIARRRRGLGLNGTGGHARGRWLSGDVVPDGAAALAEFQREPWQFDCLITDIWMPGMDGWTVAGRVRDVRPGIPVIYTTGDSDDE